MTIRPRRALPIVFGLLLSAYGSRVAAQTDPSGAWRTWTTAHFRIHAHADLDSAAVHLARQAERAYRLLSTELPPPHGRIDIALFDNVDYSNGFTSVFPSNRITIDLRAPAGDVELGRYDDWLRVVATHELTHVFHLDRAGGVWHVLRTIFGRAPGLFPNAYQPSWVDEGLAVYYESRFTTAGRERGAFHTQLLDAFAPSPRWPSAADIAFPNPVWPAGERAYAWGGRFFAREAAAHGDSVIPRFIARTSRQLWPLAISAPLAHAGGAPVGNGWRDLRRHADSARAGPAAAGRRILARGLRVEPHAVPGPAGQIAYIRDDGRHIAHLVVIDAATGRRVRAHAVNGGAEIAWLGDTLFATQFDFDSPARLLADLYRWNPDGSWQRLTHAARLREPFALPGRGVGAVSAAGGAMRVVSLREGTSDTTPLAVPPGADAWGRPAVSPDGAWTAAARHRAGEWDIVAWPTRDPAAARALTHDATLVGDPVWTLDGTRVLFFSERSGLPQIYAFTLATDSLERWTDAPAGAREPEPLAGGGLMYSTILADGYAIVVDPHPIAMSAEAAPPADTLRAAADIAVRESGYHPWPALLPRYWSPAWHIESGAGTYVGAVTSGSDVIGRTGYAAYVGLSPSPLRWEAALTVAHRRWRALALDASVEQFWEAYADYVDSAGTTRTLGHRERSAGVGATWSWRRWRSSASVRVGAEAGQDAYAFNDPAIPPPYATSAFAGAVLSAQIARVQYPALAIAPENGFVLSGVARRRRALDGSGAWSDELRGDLTTYLALPLPGFAHWVLVGEGRAARSSGPNGPLFGVGGVSSGTIAVVPGLSVGGATRTFPLRGYPASGRRYDRASTVVGELRVPLALVGRGILGGGFGIDRVAVNLFGEAGGGWNAGDPAIPLALRDVGGEVDLGVAVAYNLAFRVHAGIAVPLVDGLGVRAGTPRGYVAVGPAF